MKELGSRAIDKRTTVGKALAEWRAEILRDLGGDVSAQCRAVIDDAVTTKLVLDSIDNWLLRQPSLIYARKRWADGQLFHSALTNGCISINGHTWKVLSAFDPAFNEPDVKKALEELHELRKKLPALDKDADAKAAEAEVVKVALDQNADLAAVPAMLVERRKKRDQAEEAAVLRDTGERRIEKLEWQIKGALRARRKREADRLKKLVNAEVEAFNRDIHAVYERFSANALPLTQKISELEPGTLGGHALSPFLPLWPGGSRPASQWSISRSVWCKNC